MIIVKIKGYIVDNWSKRNYVQYTTTQSIMWWWYIVDNWSAIFTIYTIPLVNVSCDGYMKGSLIAYPTGYLVNTILWCTYWWCLWQYLIGFIKWKLHVFLALAWHQYFALLAQITFPVRKIQFQLHNWRVVSPPACALCGGLQSCVAACMCSVWQCTELCRRLHVLCVAVF